VPSKVALGTRERRLERTQIADAFRAPGGGPNGPVERDHLAQGEIAHLGEATIQFEILGENAL
jgi:hypothetical protein